MFGLFFFVCNIREQSIGVKVKETIVEKKIAPIIVIANSLNNFAVSPSRKIIGIKILIRTTEVEMMAKITSLEPEIDPSNLDRPDSTFL